MIEARRANLANSVAERQKAEGTARLLCARTSRQLARAAVQVCPPALLLIYTVRVLRLRDASLGF